MAHVDLVTSLEHGYLCVEEWSSRTARFGRYRSIDGIGHDLVVKSCHRWGPSEVQASVDHASSWHSLGGNGRALVLRFEAWALSPPTLVSEYVAGDELRRRLSDGERASGLALAPLFRSIGALLGAIHAQDPAVDGAGVTDRAPRRQVWCAGDFAVYNFRLNLAGEAVFLEPPAAKQVVSRFRDLAWFLASLRSTLGDRRSLSRDLTGAFLDGYRGMVDTWSAIDRLSLIMAVWQREALQTLRGWRRHWRGTTPKR